MNWETVAIPFAAGIKPTSHGRVLDQGRLLIAQNCFFNQDEGPQKRYGHIVRDVKTTATPVGLNGLIPPSTYALRENFSLADPGLSSTWLHGWGIHAPSDVAPTPGSFPVSTQPAVGNLFGQFTRDSEVVFWDAHRLLSYPDAAVGPFGTPSGQAVMPAMRVTPTAKSLNGQKYPDGADNGVVRTVAWIHGTNAYYSVFDSVSSACLVNETAIAMTTPTALRVITVGPWTHIIVEDTGELKMRSFHQDTPSSLISRSLGATTVRPFDVRKVDETQFVTARIDTDQIKVILLTSEGNTAASYSPDQDGETATIVSIAVNQDNVLGVLWEETGATPDVWFRSYELASGVPHSAKKTVTSTSQQSRITLTDTYLPYNTGGQYVWSAYVEDYAGGISQVRAYTVPGTAGNTLVATRYRVILASHAFRAGQRAYVWLAVATTLQPTWYLCDAQLLPIGKQSFGLANVTTSTSIHTLPSVNWHTLSISHPSKDRLVFFGALGYKQRANSSAAGAEPNGVFTEPSVNFYALDFLPRLRTAQAGRSTYIAGAQLWEYDGTTLVEAGFHQAPEGVTGATNGAGNLTADKTYRYRVDLCYKNAQNEEVRSWSAITGGVLTSAGQTKTRLTIPHVPMTRRDNAYFLIFRTEGDGTEYFLVSSRDPADSGLAANNFLKNNRASATYTFDDDLSDANLLAREYHPANADNYIQPLGAPACELVASGRDRLWLAGGELAPGEVAPSRLFAPGQTPSFSPALHIQVDRNAEPITAIGFVGEIAAFFRKTSAYSFESDGPDNVLQGSWGSPRLALADVGAVSQEGIALAGEGLYFQSTAGIRVLQPGGGLRPPGAGLIGGLGSDVDTLAQEGDYAAAVVVPKYSQIRWYSRDVNKPTLVVDYTKNVWTTWTLDCVGASYWGAGDKVVLIKGDGQVWAEEEGRYLDGDRTYETVVKSAWLHGANMGDFQRVRRWALFGDAGTGLNLRYRVFYDERDFHAEENTIAFNGDTNTSVWGDTYWGSGSWGDSANADGTSGLWFRDSKFRIRRRFARQKCAVMAIEFSDQGSNAAFSPVVLALELGRKTGLDRIP